MHISQTIADRFYEHFENELYEFSFVYKTEEPAHNSQTILELCEESLCAAYGITTDQYVNEETKVTYDEIFMKAGSMTEDVINLMLLQFIRQYLKTWSAYQFSEWKQTGKVPTHG